MPSDGMGVSNRVWMVWLSESVKDRGERVALEAAEWEGGGLEAGASMDGTLALQPGPVNVHALFHDNLLIFFAKMLIFHLLK